MTTIILVPTNLQGQPVGEHAHRTRFSDATVARARELRAAGWTLQAIAAELGTKHQTVQGWVSLKRRKPPVRVVARRVKTLTHLSGIGSVSSSDKGFRADVSKPTPMPIPSDLESTP